MPRPKNRAVPGPAGGRGCWCPHCFGPTVVKASRRDRLQAGALRRTRACLSCGLRFTTVEAPVDELTASNNALVGTANDLARRYLALGIPGRATVRQLIAALEEAAIRGAREEAAALAREQHEQPEEARA